MHPPMKSKLGSPSGSGISLQLPTEWKGILDYSWRKDLLRLGAVIIPLSSCFLQKVTRRIIKLTRKWRMLLLKSSKEVMGSGDLVNQLSLLTTSLLYI
jgi:hypothetical protein